MWLVVIKLLSWKMGDYSCLLSTVNEILFQRVIPILLLHLQYLSALNLMKIR